MHNESPGTGDTLDQYQLVEKIGEGGMGVVWRARDTSLDRDVAVKVLPPSFAADAERLARFEREAKAVAALSHPNIVAIFGFGTADGSTYAAMELLAGKTLRDHLDESPLPARKALDIARQIAAGLDAAHARGIVHRDLKPENVFITPDGRARILDFGLATAADPAQPQAISDATRTRLTSPGAVVGTVGYMSPEQVRGESVAAGSDIFALGVILYEMLSGARPFVRDTAAETMTAILREEPAALTVGGQPASPALARVVERCLEKAADERFQSARDLAFALDNATLDSGSGIRAADAQSHGVGAAQATASAPRFGRLLWPFVAVAMAASFAAGLWMQPDTPAPPTPPRVSQLTFTGADHQPSVSPDDRLIAFTSSRSGISQVWLRQVEGGGEQPLTAGPDWLPRFSPDGTSVTFIRNEDGLSSAYRVPVVGGEPRKLLDDVHEVDWAPDGQTLAFLRGAAMAERVAGTALGVFDPATGDERILVQLEGWDLLGVAWSPDGKWLATTRASTQGGAADYSLVIADPESGETQTISVANGAVLSAPAWSGADAVILASSPISVSGSPVPAAVVRVDITSSEQRLLLWQTHVFPGRGSVNSSVRMSVLGNNRLVFDTTQQSQSLERVAVDGGRYEPVTNGVSTDRQPAYSRDGSRVLFTSNRSGNVDLFSYEFATGRLLQLTEHPASDWDGAYSPDGTSIVWSSDRGGNLEIWLADADGGNPRQVSHDGVDAENPTMTPDGEWIVYSSGNPANSGIFKVRPDGSDATLLLAGNWVNPEVSPDGRYVSLVATGAARRNTVRVVDFATGQLADFGVTIDFELDMPNITYGRARWLPDGRRLAYIGVNDEGRSGVWLQDFEPGRDTTASRRPLSPFSDTNVIETFGISPDGEHVVTSALDEIRALRSVDGLPTLR